MYCPLPLPSVHGHSLYMSCFTTNLKSCIAHLFCSNELYMLYELKKYGLEKEIIKSLCVEYAILERQSCTL